MRKALARLPEGRRAAAILLLALIAATVFFIWNNSLQSPEESLRRSGLAERLTRPILMIVPVEAWHSDRMITLITRKLGHFVEYFALGAELLALSKILRPAACLKAGLLYLFAVCIAAADEALQLTSGRGAALSDVALDACGAAAGMLLAMAVCALKRRKEALV